MHLLVSQLHTFQGVIVSNANVVSVNYMVTLCYIQLWHVCIACTSDSAAFTIHPTNLHRRVVVTGTLFAKRNLTRWKSMEGLLH